MRFVSSSAAAALCVANVAAFPTLETMGLEKRQYSNPPQGAGALPNTPPPFDPSTQYVSTTGQYAFVAPGPTDQRGECPGLNALANHGYLPHSGVASIQEFMTGTYDGVGMASDLSGFLAVYGAIIDGTGSYWSIGGAPHTGIGGSHHNYECDSSPLKSDLDQYGSLGKLVMSQFYTLYDMQPVAATANYNLEVLRAFRAIRFNQSIAENPYFFYGPFDGIAVSQAAYTFIYRFMSNKSAEYPEGILNKDVLKSWMSISGPENNLTWTFGHEQIPNNFYKRNPSDSYSIPYFITDIGYFGQTDPQIFDIGCNQGKVNTYNTFSAESLTNGAATTKSLLANPFCFGVDFIEAAGPSLFGLNSSSTSQLTSALNSAASAASCPKNNITSTSLAQLENCPGFSLYGGPTGPVAPGAIQN